MNSSSSAPLLAGRTSSPSSGTAAADDRVARLLEGLNPQQRAAVLHAGAPLLIVNTIARLEDSSIIEQTTSYYRADKYEYSTRHTYSPGT